MVAIALKIRFALPFLAVAAVVEPVRAGDQPKAIPLASTQCGPRPSNVDQAKPRAPGPLEAQALGVEAEAPVILDAAFYVEFSPNASAEFGIVHRRIDSPRYH